MENINPCPFCGSGEIGVSDYKYLFCRKCGAHGPRVDTETNAIKKWNKRVDFVKHIYNDGSSKTEQFCCDCENKTIHGIEKMCDSLKDLLVRKNKNYGSSAISKPMFTNCSALDGLFVRFGDKIRRLHSLRLGEQDLVGESIKDTVMDIAGYSILILLEIENKESKSDTSCHRGM